MWVTGGVDHAMSACFSCSSGDSSCGVRFAVPCPVSGETSQGTTVACIVERTVYETPFSVVVNPVVICGVPLAAVAAGVWVVAVAVPVVVSSTGRITRMLIRLVAVTPLSGVGVQGSAEIGAVPKKKDDALELAGIVMNLVQVACSTEGMGGLCAGDDAQPGGMGVGERDTARYHC